MAKIHPECMVVLLFAVLGFIASAPCEDSVSARCDENGENCLYTANWTVRGDLISFEVRATTTGWVGIGFSDDQLMPNSDIVVGAADAQGSFIHDRLATARAMPPIDASQDIILTDVSVSNGDVIMQFTRPLNSGDPSDISLDQCRFLLFAFSGSFNISDNTIMYHGFENRMASTKKFCFPSAEFCPAPVCPSLPDPTNGNVSFSRGTVFGSIATYSCSENYTLLGNETRTCQYDEQWSGDEPTCIPDGQSGPPGRVNCAPDTIIEDPLYTVPLKTDLRKANPQLAMEITPDNPLNLCFEVYGNPDTYYNLISSKCVTVNAHYNDAHSIDQIVIYVVSPTIVPMCQDIVVKDDCSFTPRVNPSSGIDISETKSGLVLTVFNCEDKELIIEIECTTKPLRFRVIRGLDSKHDKTHGLLGQFWNNEVQLCKFDGEVDYDDYDTSDLYTIEIPNVGPKDSVMGKRKVTGHLRKIKWEGAPGYCLYVGNSNAGPMYGVRYPNDPVIEGRVSDYEVEQRIDKVNLDAYTFNHFDTGLC